MSLNSIRVDIDVENPRLRNLETRVSGLTDEHSNTPITFDGIEYTTRGFDLHRKEGIVVFLDVLGMKGIWKRKPVIKVVNNWKSVIRSFMDVLQPLNSGSYLRALSDTIIVTIPGSLDYSIVDRTFDLLLAPFIHSLKLGMLLRGVVSHGIYYLSNNLIIGEAVDDAAFNHDKVNWIGVSLSPNLSTKINDITRVNTNSIMWSYIPHKTSPYRGFALNWPIHDPTGECNSSIKKENISSDPSIREKHHNTSVFYQSCRSSRG
jgi:hypothetical protein